MTVIGAPGRGRSARLQLDRSDAIFDPNQVIRLSAEAIAFGYERCGLWKGAADVRVENVSRGEAGSREQSAPNEPCQGRGDEGKEEEHRLRSIFSERRPRTSRPQQAPRQREERELRHSLRFWLDPHCEHAAD